MTTDWATISMLVSLAAGKVNMNGPQMTQADVLPPLGTESSRRKYCVMDSPRGVSSWLSDWLLLLVSPRESPLIASLHG